MRPLTNTLLMRVATEQDMGAVTRLLRDCIADMRQANIDQWDERYPSPDMLLTDIRAGTMHLGFKHGMHPLGALVLDELQDAEWSNVPWMITDVSILVAHRLMVNPQHQGQGIGSELMQFAETWARAKGYGSIRLDAFSGNPRALNLYHRLGYTDVGGVSFRKGLRRCFEKRLLSLTA